MKSKSLGYLIIGILFVFLLLWSSFFIVEETQFGVVTRFGRPLEKVRTPGLNIKLPWPIDKQILLDRRILVYENLGQSLMTEDLKNLIFDNYITWKIINPIKFIETIRTINNADNRIKDISLAGQGVFVGEYPLERFINLESGEIDLDELTAKVKDYINAVVQKDFGLQVIEFFIANISLPAENRQSVITRMQSERQRISTRYRSIGEEEALKIEGGALADKERILGRAQGKATEIRGKGEAKALSIFAKAYSLDPKFYQFLRSLQSYEAIIDHDSTIFLDSNSKLLRYFNPEINEKRE